MTADVAPDVCITAQERASVDGTAPARQWLPGLVVLAAIWGTSFLFIKVGVRELHPLWLTFGRVAAGAAVAARGAGGDPRPAAPRPGALGSSDGGRHVRGLGAVHPVRLRRAACLVSAGRHLERGHAAGRVAAGGAGVPHRADDLAPGCRASPSASPAYWWCSASGSGTGGSQLTGQLMCFGAAMCYAVAIPYQKKFVAGRSGSGVSLAAAQLIIASGRVGDRGAAAGRRAAGAGRALAASAAVCAGAGRAGHRLGVRAEPAGDPGGGREHILVGDVFDAGGGDPRGRADARTSIWCGTSRRAR